MITNLLALFIAYLLGSVPFGMLLRRAAERGLLDAFNPDKKKITIATLALNGTKGLLAVWLARYLTGDEWAGLAASVLAVAGHMFPLWRNVEGGKGVATTIGVFFGLAPWLGIVVLFIWLAVFKFTRIFSLAALVSIGAAPVLSMLAGNTLLLFASLVLATLVFWRHQDSIQRLRTGTELPYDIHPPS